jgi:hypothetical protein
MGRNEYKKNEQERIGCCGGNYKIIWLMATCGGCRGQEGDEIAKKVGKGDLSTW